MKNAKFLPSDANIYTLTLDSNHLLDYSLLILDHKKAAVVQYINFYSPFLGIVFFCMSNLARSVKYELITSDFPLSFVAAKRRLFMSRDVKS